MTAQEPTAEPGPDVLESDPPRLTTEQAARIAARAFGLDGTATPLASERDQNFLIDDGRGSRGVLKISNPHEEPAVVDMETLSVLHALRADPELPLAVPWLRPGADPGAGAAAYRARVPGPEGSRAHLVRLFAHVPGSRASSALELDHDGLWEFGAVVARLGRALRGFFHPAAGRVLLWDVQHAATLGPLAASIREPRRRAIVERVIDRFERTALPRWPQLRAQVIHGDVTLDNALVDGSGRVTGIVDFGDMSFTALACDISSALASVLWEREGDEFFRAATALVDGYASVTPLEDLERELLPELLAARAAAGASISAVRMARYPDNEYIRGFDDEAWPVLELLDELDPAEAAARFLGRSTPSVPSTIDHLVDRRKRSLGSALSPLTYERPLHLVRGQGVWMIDSDGSRYLDVYNNVPVVGHCHPRVTEAVVRQARELNTNMRYLHEAVIQLAERLVATMPAGSGLDTVMMVNSGSEANDLAWRLATTVTGNAAGVVTDFAYHGITSAIAELSPEEWRPGWRPRHVETFAPADPYRDPSPHGQGFVDRSAQALANAIRRLAARGFAPAAIYVDGGFVSDGILAPPHDYLRALVRIAHEEGALYVADEVQVGHGRTGQHLWSFAAAGIAPDIVTLGKPMGNGYPVAAVITRSDIVDRFAEETEFFSTFGGNPPAAAAALAVLDVIRDEELVSRAASIGSEMRERIRDLSKQHPALGDVRGTGLLIGVELVADPESREPEPELAVRVVNGLRERGILVGSTGRRGNVLKIRPPLVFGPRHVDMLIDTLEAVLPATAPG